MSKTRKPKQPTLCWIEGEPVLYGSLPMDADYRESTGGEVYTKMPKPDDWTPQEDAAANAMPVIPVYPV